MGTCTQEFLAYRADAAIELADAKTGQRGGKQRYKSCLDDISACGVGMQHGASDLKDGGSDHKGRPCQLSAWIGVFQGIVEAVAVAVVAL